MVYEVVLQKTVTYYQLVTIEEADSEDNAIDQAYDVAEDYDWEFADDDVECIECEQIS